MCVCGIDKVILTVEDLSMQRKNGPSATLLTTNPTWLGMGLKSSLHGERLAAEPWKDRTANLNPSCLK